MIKIKRGKGRHLFIREEDTLEDLKTRKNSKIKGKANMKSMTDSVQVKWREKLIKNRMTG